MSLENMFNEINPPDNKCPYVCTINISLNFSKVLPSGDFAHYNIPTSKLDAEYQISKNGVFTVFGFDLDDCINKTKKIISQLHYEEEHAE